MRGIFIFCIIVFTCLHVWSQTKPAVETKDEKTTTAKEEKTNLPNIIFNPDKTVVTDHTTTIKGQRIPYKAITGTMPVWDEEGKCIAGLFYTYYERSDIKDRRYTATGHIIQWRARFCFGMDAYCLYRSEVAEY